MNLTRVLKQNDFEKAYNALEKMDFEYTLSNLTRVFPNCNLILLYTFLMYSISKKETIQKHLSICECLTYMEPYIYESTFMVRWHINHALSLQEDSEKIMAWVIEVYGADPSSPFSEIELTTFAQNVILKQPGNLVAYNFLNSQKNN